MQLAAENIKAFFHSFNSHAIQSFEKIPQSGGDRMYFRITTDETSYIATFNENLKENIAFLNFTRQLREAGAPVPEIYEVHPGKQMYIQEDFGNRSLLNELEEKGLQEDVFDLFRKSLNALAALQIRGDEHIDYRGCITSKEFGKQAILSDLLYFK